MQEKGQKRRAYKKKRGKQNKVNVNSKEQETTLSDKERKGGSFCLKQVKLLRYYNNNCKVSVSFNVANGVWQVTDFFVNSILAYLWEAFACLPVICVHHAFKKKVYKVLSLYCASLPDHRQLQN